MADSNIVHFTDDDALVNDPTFHRLAEYFGFSKEKKYAHKDSLKYLLDWARSDKEVKDELDILWKVRSAEKQFQTENFKENRAASLRKFLFLNDQKETITKEETLLREQNGTDTVGG
jgi:hypothetical protein